MMKAIFLAFLLLAVSVHTDEPEVQIIMDDQSQQQVQPGNYQIKNSVYILTDADFRQALQQFDFIFIKFFAPWCGHCKSMASAYIETAKNFETTGSSVKIAQVDCTIHKQVCQQKQIKGYPTLLFFKNGQAVKYQGGRTKEAITAWIQAQTATGNTVQPDTIGQL